MRWPPRRVFEFSYRLLMGRQSQKRWSAPPLAVVLVLMSFGFMGAATIFTSGLLEGFRNDLQKSFDEARKKEELVGLKNFIRLSVAPKSPGEDAALPALGFTPAGFEVGIGRLAAKHPDVSISVDYPERVDLVQGWVFSSHEINDVLSYFSSPVKAGGGGSVGVSFLRKAPETHVGQLLERRHQSQTPGFDPDEPYVVVSTAIYEEMGSPEHVYVWLGSFSLTPVGPHPIVRRFALVPNAFANKGMHGVLVPAQFWFLVEAMAKRRTPWGTLDTQSSTSFSSGLLEPKLSLELSAPLGRVEAIEAAKKDLDVFLDPQGLQAFIASGYLEMASGSPDPFQPLKLLRVISASILVVLFLAGALQLVSALRLVTQARRRDIAILRTLGWSQGDIVVSFTLFGVAIAMASFLVGGALGLLLLDTFNPLLGALSEMMKTDLGKVFVAYPLSLWTGLAVLNLVCGLAVCIFPARGAARENPALVFAAED